VSLATPIGERLAYFCDYAWLGGPSATPSVLIEVVDGVIRSVETGAARPPAAIRLAGLTLPGFANAHSHAFHRALRGRTEGDRGNFWTWRDTMYTVAARLDPDRYYALARATYAEMVLAGFTSVGEFHYLHHEDGGRPYASANVMGEALAAAASDAGIRLTLLDTCYLERAPGEAASGIQLRFADRDVDTWASRTGGLRAREGVRLGVAIHSVRAVPPAAARLVAEVADARGVPLHFHLSEQPAENATSLAHYGRTPTELLESLGALGGSSVAVHATHLTDRDLDLLAGAATGACICPTTERNLADGIGPARRLLTGGAPLSIGSDSQAVIDPFAEIQGLEAGERLASGERVRFVATELLDAATRVGHRAIGWPECGIIGAGHPADLVTIGLGSPRLAGWTASSLLDLAVSTAGAGDVDHVIVAGRPIVVDGIHQAIPEVAAALTAAITTVVAPP
jgi:formiminoglutamate deiminase